jgi:membrane fusion protein (multidrug efflux system)
MKQFLLIALVAAVAAVAWYVFGPAADRGAPGIGGPAAGAGAFGGRRPDPPLVVLGQVRREAMLDTVDALGTAQANESVTLTAKVTDTVRRVGFEDGDYVEVGSILVELTNQEEEALLAEARANLEDASRQLARLEELSAVGLAPDSELDIARSREAASQARLDTVLARLADRLILAPFAGVLGFRQVSPGTLVTPTTAITTLDDISIIKLDFTVPEVFLGAMTPGARVLAESASYPGRQFVGVVRTVGSRVDPVTRAVQVRAHIENEDRALRPGMLLTARVVMAERDVLVVPESAVFQIQSRAYVYTVDAQLTARQHEIEIGERRRGIVEVVAGLDAGDTIVVEGLIKLRDGIVVRAEQGSAAGQSATPILEQPPIAAVN